MATTAIADDFLTAFAQIPRRVQKKVREFTEKFRDDPTSSSIRYEPIEGARDSRLRSVRVGLDYRAIVLAPEQGDVYVLLWVDHHDEAYRWAANRRVDVHPATGALQVYVTTDAPPVPANEGASAGHEADPAFAAYDSGGRFGQLTDEQLFAAGVPQPLLPAVRAVYSDSDFDALVPHLPPEASEVLTGVAAGLSLDDALEEVLGAEPAKAQPQAVDTEDVAAALQRPQSARRFRILDEDFDLEKALDYPLDKWRVFLHPMQRSLVERPYPGPMRVLGAAGTGKTVVAMHRAVWLVRNLISTSDSVLFTTFNVNLVTDVRDQLRKIATEQELERIEVQSIDRLASSILRAAGEEVQFATENQLRDAWQQAVDTYGEGPWDLEFYRAEWRGVVQAQDIRTEQEYVRASRAGRGTRLRRSERTQVWPVLERFHEILDERGLVESIDLLRWARRRVADDPQLAPHRHIVVDETQDMNSEALRLLRTIAGDEHENDLFLVGDAHQRIYGRPVSLSSCGINIRGRRSRRLRINYRTTDTIRRFALRTLQGEQFDDLDEGSADVKGYVSLRSGPEPIVRHFDDLAGERGFLVSTINELLQDGVPPAHICVVARTHEQLDEAYGPALRAAGIEVEELGQGPPRTDHVRLATMHRVKGLEFPVMFLAGINKGYVPLATAELEAPDPVVSRLAMKRERCLLYVASSRARDRLYVSSNGTQSPFLEPPS